MTHVRCTACGSEFEVPFSPDVVRRMPRCGVCDDGELVLLADDDLRTRAARERGQSAARRDEAAAVRAEARQVRLAAARRRGGPPPVTPS